MGRPAHPQAMTPHRPGSTRTAAPQLPDKFPFGGRYAGYTLFAWTGVVYLLVGFLALRVVWALGNGPDAFGAVIASFENPIYIAFHLLSLLAVCFVGVRFFNLFPKAQPPQIGPVKPPPAPVILTMLYGAWFGVTVLLSAILAGGLF